MDVNKKRIRSLGWLTESGVMPKNKKAMEGVGVSSLLELRAQLYKTQEEAKRNKDAVPDVDLPRARKRNKAPSRYILQQNSGVEDRAHRLSALIYVTGMGDLVLRSIACSDLGFDWFNIHQKLQLTRKSTMRKMILLPLE